MRVAICDDDKVQLELLNSYVNLWGEKQEEPCEIFSYPSCEAFLFVYEDMSFDLILLDIQMGAMSGIEMAKKIRHEKDEVAIIFITGIADYVFEGYNVKALNYLLKPIKEEKLYECLDEALDDIRNEKPYIILEEKKTQKIYLHNIIYFESMSHECIINCTDKVIKTKKGIQNYEDTLDKNLFYRCHRSYIINISKIQSISKNQVDMINDDKIPIARGKWEEVNKMFLKYCRSSLC